MLRSIRLDPARLSTIRNACLSETRYSSIHRRPTFNGLTTLQLPSASYRFFHSSQHWSNAQAEQIARTPQDDFMSTSSGDLAPQRFGQLAEQGLVCRTLVRTLTESMNLDKMTEVQSKTIAQSTRGLDVLGQARTGTGKTLAFLVPVVQQIIAKDPSLERKRYHDSSEPNIRAIVISPTRELAEQIYNEARRLVADTNIRIQLAVGGTSKRAHLSKLQHEGCHILVGTPGRLKDLLSDPASGVRAPSLHTLVLDEADRLLDDGFGPDIRAIEQLLPSKRQQERQTLMFSATFPQEVMSMVKLLMNHDFEFVQTVQPGEQQTHDRVPQRLVYLNGLENIMPAITELCKTEMAKRDAAAPFKAIVFFNASASATLAYHLFRSMRSPYPAARVPFVGLSIFEMHAKLTQPRRTSTAAGFRAARSAIMFSSDVSARGMDFPNVTHVISVGTPPTRDTYVHRIGRTARVDKGGEAWLLVPRFEGSEPQNRLGGLPLRQATMLQSADADLADLEGLSPDVRALFDQTVAAAQAVDPSLKKSAYRANIGTYQWHHSKPIVIQAMNRQATLGWGMDRPPGISPQLAQRLALTRVPGIVIEQDRFQGSQADRPYRGRQDQRSYGQGPNRTRYRYSNLRQDRSSFERYESRGPRNDSRGNRVKNEDWDFGS